MCGEGCEKSGEMWKGAQIQIRWNLLIMGSLRGESAFSAMAREVRMVSGWLVGWLKCGQKGGPVSALVMPDLLWFNVGGIQSLREIRMLQSVCHLRPLTHTGKVRDLLPISFTNPVRK